MSLLDVCWLGHKLRAVRVLPFNIRWKGMPSAGVTFLSGKVTKTICQSQTRPILMRIKLLAETLTFHCSVASNNATDADAYPMDFKHQIFEIRL